MPLLNMNNMRPITLTGGRVAELVLDPVFQQDIFSYARRMRAVDGDGVPVMTLSGTEKIVQPNTGCAWTPSGDVTITSRNVTSKKHKINMEFCLADLHGSVVEGVLGDGNNIANLSATEAGRKLLNAILEVVNQNLAKDLYALGMLGGYNNTSDVVPTWYQQNEGLLKKIEDSHAAEGITPVDASSGAELTAGESVTILQAMLDAQSTELESIPDGEKVFSVTPKIAKNYRAYLQALGTEIANTDIINGRKFLTYQGIPLEEHPILYSKLVADFGYTVPHRAILRPQGTLVVATDVNGNPTLTIEPDPRLQMFYVYGFFRFGTDFASPNLIVYAK